jgi:Zinc dependent phospholipase C
MKNFKNSLFTVVICIVGLFSISWGIVGHERISRAAVLALPKPLQVFFYNHIDFITQESTVPDLRKYVLNDKAEGQKHYFDMENFGIIDSFPKTMDAAKKKYDEKFLAKNGTLPWHIQDVMVKLTKAFKDKKRNEILFLSGDLAHYIADAHMPLHTSDNHDGQNTNQKGIHALWESRIPELFANNYKLHVEEAKYFENVDKATWDLIFDTHSLVEPLLAADKPLRTSTPENKMYEVDDKGELIKSQYKSNIYSVDYSNKLHIALNGMVESQMKKAISATSSFWYTAWVNAGKPDLSKLDDEDLTKRNSKFLRRDLKLWKKDKVFGIVDTRE